MPRDRKVTITKLKELMNHLDALRAYCSHNSIFFDWHGGSVYLVAIGDKWKADFAPTGTWFSSGTQLGKFETQKEVIEALKKLKRD